MGAFFGAVVGAFLLGLVIEFDVIPYLKRIARAQEKLAGIEHSKNEKQ